jgi:hypothetical protein
LSTYTKTTSRVSETHSLYSVTLKPNKLERSNASQLTSKG